MRNRYFLLLDLALLSLAPFIALMLRFEGAAWLDGYFATAIWFALGTLPIKLALAWRAGLYRCIWRFASIVELERILAVGLASAAVTTAIGVGLKLAGAPQRMPLSAIAIDAMLTLAIFAGPRLGSRFLHLRRRREGKAVRTLVVGAGAAGQMVARESKLGDRVSFEVVGFLDDDRSKIGQMLQGCRVLGKVDSLPSLVRDLRHQRSHHRHALRPRGRDPPYRRTRLKRRRPHPHSPEHHGYRLRPHRVQRPPPSRNSGPTPPRPHPDRHLEGPGARQRPHGHGDRRRREHRLRTLPPDRRP